MWSTFVADHALTSAIVDHTRGLRADLTRSAFHLENAAASSFQQGGCVAASAFSGFVHLGSLTSYCLFGSWTDKVKGVSTIVICSW
jgi:hypothetical protein